MLFSIFNKRPYAAVPVPEAGYRPIGFDSTNPDRDWSCTLPIFAPWSEIERPEYNYQFNKDGFRCIDFSQEPEIIVLGCSVTLGQGLPAEQTWPHLLTEKLNKHGRSLKYGNISYSGGSPMKAISAFFSIVNLYDYEPKYVIANFPNLERFWFISTDMNHMYDYHLSRQRMKVKASAPYDYSELIPIEQAYFLNLEYIKMLETFCVSAGIKLIWSTWTTNLTMEMEQFLLDNFENYLPDITRNQWRPDFEYAVDAKNEAELLKIFRIKKEYNCHQEYSHLETFDYGYDYHRLPGNPSGEMACWPHPGLHRHLHWAEMYEKKLTS